MLAPLTIAAFIVTARARESFAGGTVVPWALLALALATTTMAVRAMSPVLHVAIAAALLWYVWKVPAVKTMMQKAAEEVTSVLPTAAPAPAAAVAPAPAPAAPAAEPPKK